MASCSGAKPSAPEPPPMPLRPKTNGSTISLKNWFMCWKVTGLAVAFAFTRQLGQRILQIGAGEIEHGTKFPGSAPPALKKLFRPLATCC